MHFYCRLEIVNINDNPAISLVGESPIIRDLAVNYTEGSGPMTIVPNVFVIDTDPVEMISR